MPSLINCLGLQDLLLLNVLSIGVWLGKLASHTSEGLKIFIPRDLLKKDVTEEQVLSVSRSSTSADKLAVGLLTLMFTKSQLAYGNATPTHSRWNILNADIQLGIRSKYMFSDYCRTTSTL